MDDISKWASNAELDQAMAGATSIARLLGNYYNVLTAAGTPSELAMCIVRDWHWLLIHRSNYPNYPPQVVPE